MYHNVLIFALSLSPHFHAIVSDGVWVQNNGENAYLPWGQMIPMSQRYLSVDWSLTMGGGGGWLSSNNFYSFAKFGLWWRHF